MALEGHFVEVNVIGATRMLAFKIASQLFFKALRACSDRQRLVQTGTSTRWQLLEND